MASQDPISAKRELRRRMAAARDAQPGERARRAATRATEHLLALPEIAEAGGVLVCLSFGSEIDTAAFVEELERDGRRVYAPRAETERRLSIHRLPCPLEKLSFGLRQPTADAPRAAADEIDSILDAAVVAGLAFDHRGYRLGYGKGYFDRFLAGRPFPAVGLGFRFQLVDEVPVEPHDVPLAAIVTEAGVHRPGDDPGNRPAT